MSYLHSYIIMQCNYIKRPMGITVTVTLCHHCTCNHNKAIPVRHCCYSTHFMYSFHCRDTYSDRSSGSSSPEVDISELKFPSLSWDWSTCSYCACVTHADKCKAPKKSWSARNGHCKTNIFISCFYTPIGTICLIIYDTFSYWYEVNGCFAVNSVGFSSCCSK